MKPWSIKYLPQNTEGIKGQNKAVESLKLFLDKFPRTRAALLYGPPGCGKTSLAYDFNLRVFSVL